MRAAKRNPWFSNKVASVAWSVGAEAANVITVTATLKDRNGRAVTEKVALPWYLSSDADGAAPLVTSPTGGTVAGASGGALIESVAERSGLAISTAAGVLRFAVTDTGTPTMYVNLVLPDGSVSTSPAVTFA